MVLGWCLSTSNVYASATGGEPHYQEVKAASPNGSESDATFFSAGGKKAVVLASGFRFNKVSWYFLAELLQQRQIAALPLSGSSGPDVLNGISFLKEKGFTDITLVGASMGGMGVLSALEKTDENITGFVVLAPAGGVPIKKTTIRKLFVVAENDGTVYRSEVYKLYENSAEPKTFKEYGGSDHAQELFGGDHKEDLVKLIIDFVDN